MSTRTSVRRFATLAAALFAVAGTSLAVAPAAHADAVGYVRLAHLAPDCGMVDVYLSSQTGATPTKVIPSVDYGDVSGYYAMPPGPYAVALREAGAGPNGMAELATQLTVQPGHAYTVAALGMRADLGARVLNDDFSLAPAGKARVRIVQAAAQTPVLDVSVANGASIANQIAYASTTNYQIVDDGRYTVRLRQPTGNRATAIDVQLNDGSVYSLFVLDKKTGLTAELRSDALRSGKVPTGGVPAGAGGGRAGRSVLPALGAWLLVGATLVVALTLGRRRRPVPVSQPSGR